MIQEVTTNHWPAVDEAQGESLQSLVQRLQCRDQDIDCAGSLELGKALS